MKAIVVGCGIGGLTAAIAMRQAGHEVCLYERAPQLTEVGAGISLWANAFHALDLIGVGDAIRASSLGMVKSELRVKDGHQVVGSFDARQIEQSMDTQPLLAIIHRAVLVDQLASRLPKDSLFFGRECVGIVPSSGPIEVRFADGSSDSADLVIGADGIRSVVRKEIFGSEPVRYSGYTCFRGMCARPESVSAGYIAEWWGRGKRVGITTMRNDQVYWWATLNSAPNRHREQAASELATQFRSWADPWPQILRSTPDEAILQNDIIDRKPTRNWSQGRIVLIGDAAHPTTPNLGQGGCLAIEDGVALPYFLRNHESIEVALQQFVAARSSRAHQINRTSWRNGQMGQLQGSIPCWLRNQAVSLLFNLLGTEGITRYARYRVPSIPSSQA